VIKGRNKEVKGSGSSKMYFMNIQDLTVSVKFSGGSIIRSMPGQIGASHILLF
jgi:hypothetical protein